MESLISWWSGSRDLLGLPLLALISWLTYWDVLRGLWVIDDDQGIAPYNGVLQRPVSVGNCWKKFRFEATKVPNPDREWATKKFPPYIVHPRAHHRFNIWLHCGAMGMLYGALSRLIGTETAFLTTLLFTVHPLGTQTVAWISGCGYVAGAFLMLTGVNVAYLLRDAGWLTSPELVLAALGLYGLIQWLAVEIMFAMLGIFGILWWAGLTPFAWIAGGLALMSGIHAFREAVTLRAKVFTEQNMARSLTFHWRKSIVVLKTLGYCTVFIWWPKRMGLYHTYAYHYELPYVEAEDKWMWVGLSVLGLSVWGLWAGPPPVQLAILWHYLFLGLFLNWITANQFLAERYAWLSAVGSCLLVATYAPAWAFWTLTGLALMRTWAHLPTYYNETQFYLSNMWNFPGSEVALGNLGVAYMRRGLVGTAMETWLLGLSLNKEYDVCWYNLGEALKTRGPVNFNYIPLLTSHIPAEVIQAAIKEPIKAHFYLTRYCLERAIASKVCHFKERWTTELAELNKLLALTPDQLLKQAAASVETSATATTGAST